MNQIKWARSNQLHSSKQISDTVYARVEGVQCGALIGVQLANNALEKRGISLNTYERNPLREEQATLE